MAKDKKAKVAEKKARVTQKQDKKTKQKEKKGKAKGLNDVDSGDDVDLDKVLADYARRQEQFLKITESVCEPPSPRASAAILGSPSNEHELFIFGGEYFNGALASFYNDLFIYNINRDEWRKVTSPNSPLPRSGHAWCRGGNAGGMYLFGGEFSSPKQGTFYHYNDLWRLEPSSREWTRLETKGKGPPARSGHRMTYFKNYVVLFGGFQDTSQQTKYLQDLWLYDCSKFTWEQPSLPASQRPDPRSSFTFLPHEFGAVLYGGYSRVKTLVSAGKGSKGGGTQATRNILKPLVHEDAWFLRITPAAAGAAPDTAPTVRWERRKKPVNAPNPPRAGSTMAYHKGRGIQFGGVHDVEQSEEGIDSEFFNSLHAWNVDRNRCFQLTLHRPRMAPRKQIVNSEKGRRGRQRADEDELLANLAALELKGTVPAEAEDSLAVPGETKESGSTATKTEKLTLWEMPHPRFNAQLAVQNDVLYIFGGTFEKGDREYTFDELWAVDLGKLDGIKEIYRREVADWQGSEDGESEDEGEEDSESESDEEEVEDGASTAATSISEVRHAPPQATVKILSEEAVPEREESSLADSLPHPRPFESLRDFYSRTSLQWQDVFLSAQNSHSGGVENKSVKEVRKGAFELAEEKWWDCREEIRALEDEQEEAGIGEVVNLAEKISDATGGAGRRRALPPVSSGTSNSVWVGDDLLSEVWERFARSPILCSKRHGSNVPGPLEFRKRLARRRMMDVASQNGRDVAPPPESSLSALFRWGRRPTKFELNWEPPSPPHDLDVPPPLPDWLSDIDASVSKDMHLPETIKEGQMAADSAVAVPGRDEQVGDPGAPYWLAQEPRSTTARSVEEPTMGPFLSPVSASPSSASNPASEPEASELNPDFAPPPSPLPALRSTGYQDIAAQMSTMTSLKDIRIFVDGLGLENSVKKLKVSELVLARLFDLDMSCKRLVTFMAHRQLEFTSPMILHLLSHYSQHPLEKEEYPLLLSKVKSSVVRDAIDGNWEILVLSSLPEVVDNVSSDPTWKQQALLDGYTKFFPALRNRGGKRSARFRATIVRKVVRELAARPPCVAASILMRNMISYLEDLDQSHKSWSLTIEISKCLVSWTRQLSETPTAGRDSLTVFRRIRDAMRPILESMPASVAKYLPVYCIDRLSSPVEGDAASTRLKWTLAGFLAALKDIPEFADSWPHIHDCLSQKFKLAEFPDLGLQLMYLGDSGISRLYYRYWIVRYLRQSANDNLVFATKSRRLSSLIAQPNRSVAASDEELIVDPYAQLVKGLVMSNLPYDDHLADVLELLHRTYRPMAVHNLLKVLWKDYKVQVPCRLVLHWILKFVDTEPFIAFCLFDTHSSVRLSSCPQLPISLINNTPTHPEKILSLLDRKEHDNNIPVSLRTVITDQLSESRVQLVHDIATTFAHAEHRRPRSALRAVWHCYRYLRDRQAPLYPSMSKALVHCGLARPLEKGQWVSSVLFRWIYALVKELEGQHVADELDKLLWIWRGRIVADSVARRRMGVQEREERQLLRGYRRRRIRNESTYSYANRGFRGRRIERWPEADVVAS